MQLERVVIGLEATSIYGDSLVYAPVSYTHLYLADKLTEHSVVISKAEGLALLRKRGYIFKDELAVESG